MLKVGVTIKVKCLLSASPYLYVHVPSPVVLRWDYLVDEMPITFYVQECGGIFGVLSVKSVWKCV